MPNTLDWIDNPIMNGGKVQSSTWNSLVLKGWMIDIGKTIGQVDPSTQVANLLTGKPHNKHNTSSTKESQQTNEEDLQKIPLL
jgi:hypothetical protein